MLTVRLSHAFNPDISEGYWSGGTRPSAKTAPVSSYAEASRLCREYITQHDLGGGNWNGGQVFLDREQVANVSFNGRVWDMNGTEIQITLLALDQKEHEIIWSYPSSDNAKKLGMGKTGCYSVKINGALVSGHPTYTAALDAVTAAGTVPTRWSMDNPKNSHFLQQDQPPRQEDRLEPEPLEQPPRLGGDDPAPA
jgi:hypothetical protein